MEKKYYRILNIIEEPAGVDLVSNRMNEFRKEVFAYRKLSHCIYVFSLKTGLQVKSAVRLAENVPAYLDVLNDFFQSGREKQDLMEIGVMDPIGSVNGDDLYDFVSNYIAEINESGLYYDWGKDYYLWEFVWEMIRYTEFPDMPSRMDSVFLFDNEEDAASFQKEYRDDPRFKQVQVEFQDGITEEFDMSWFSDVPSDIPMSKVQEYARNYWSQKKTDHPVIEVLHKGNYCWK